MGRLLQVHQCLVCNYFIEGDLHHGTSGISTLFLRNHYTLAVCRTCRNLVSVLIPNTPQQTNETLHAARHALVQMEADAIVGDPQARDLLPLFREALDTFDENEPGAVGQCSVCGSTDLEFHDDIDPTLFDEQDAWLRCPRCPEGQLLIETVGQWM
jgi:hypothetical protein